VGVDDAVVSELESCDAIAAVRTATDVASARHALADDAADCVVAAYSLPDGPGIDLTDAGDVDDVEWFAGCIATPVEERLACEARAA
jgi:DNA-binding NarL/FixJ family response regulator